MADTKSMTTTESGQVQRQAEQEIFLRPPVDIYEDATGITVKADLPGVARDRLNVQVDGNNLTIEGQVVIDMPEGMKSLYADVNTTRFRRSFTLSKELQADKISAEINNGELTLRLPKSAEVQPRKIEISGS
ncbi:Hsp20/alpha crystallin family protein [Accumulibacter sp.]|uniref:Hsp20/alpha crystallin family protein n=1 Tax=Accumulibacter sp. TaxID=2053492 RepID=UPI00262ADD0A|nr:Hsp20/alpha crystallin family protein [Accumulibacter sp.]